MTTFIRIVVCIIAFVVRYPNNAVARPRSPLIMRLANRSRQQAGGARNASSDRITDKPSLIRSSFLADTMLSGDKALVGHVNQVGNLADEMLFVLV